MKRIILSIFVCLLCLTGWAQQTVSAHVVDSETGEALPYVTVYVSQEKYTITNAEGDFSLQASESDMVQVSCFGYAKQTIPVTDVSGILKLTPARKVVRELTITEVKEILSNVQRTAEKDLRKNKKKTATYFYRQTSTYPTGNDLAEFFLDANSAVCLRQIKYLSGRKGHVAASSVKKGSFDNTSLSHLTELAPMMGTNLYWNFLVTPLDHAEKDKPNHERYDVKGELMDVENGHQVYHICLSPKEEEKNCILTGDLYTDANTGRILLFDGQLSGMEIELAKDFRKMSTSAKASLHVEYNCDKGYSEVTCLAVGMEAQELKNTTVVWNVDGMDIQLVKTTRKAKDDQQNMNEDMFDKAMLAHTDMIQRTSQERDMAQRIKDEKDLQPMQNGSGGFTQLVDRLAAFGKTIPQEKVYVHMDNTCYFLGDTIWFSAYTRQTTDDCPSKVSGVLYVELFNQDGYLVERKLIEMKEGHGYGFFSLNKEIQYSGFYELRAYTRWQLNWGEHQHPHSAFSYDWFLSKMAEEKYYRDYDKLYSRVFPVYDRPTEEGDNVHNMTLRPMRRYFRRDMNQREIVLTLFPEGGNLIAGVPCRMAFEAAWDDGEWVDGCLHLGSDSVRTQNRGRGVISFTPQQGAVSNAFFVSDSGTKVSVRLPKIEDKGVSLNVFREGTDWQIRATATGIPSDSLALTIMREGHVEEYLNFPCSHASYTFQSRQYKPGVHQVTVFDQQGRIWADRIFFVVDSMPPTLTIAGMKEQYKPYEKIDFNLQSTSRKRLSDGTLSISVRDMGHSDILFDNGNILTEMLLSSEIRGFVPNPGWYFERDDEEHHQALDLLMMTQGWRRFNWRDMAVRGAWDLTQPDEQTPIIDGYVTKYVPRLEETEEVEETKETEDSNMEETSEEQSESQTRETYNKEIFEEKEGTYIKDTHTRRQWEEGSMLKKDVMVHAEMVGTDGIRITDMGESEKMTSNGGFFRFQLPRTYNQNFLFLGAEDPKKIKTNHVWVKLQEYEENKSLKDLEELYGNFSPDYNVRILWPYPRFVKPYSFYQNHLSMTSDTIGLPPELLADGTRRLREISVRAPHGGLRKFDDSQPAIKLDAYEAYNNAYDAGMSNLYVGLKPEGQKAIVRAIVSDYGLEQPYVQDINSSPDRIQIRFGMGVTRRNMPAYMDIPLDSIYNPRYLRSFKVKPLGSLLDPEEEQLERGLGDGGGLDISPGERRDYDNLCKLDRYYIYTDYCPRLEGDERYYGANLPETTLCIYPYPDGSRRAVYQDRRIKMPGFSVCEDFYSPDYSKHRLPEGQKDYRRTLYWNPNLKLDENGQARITFYNNSRTTQISVEAEGQARDGTLLWSK